MEGYALGEDKNKEGAPEHKTLMLEDSDADDFASDSKRLKRLKKVKGLSSEIEADK